MSTGEENLDSPVTTAESETETQPERTFAYEVQIDDVGPCKKHLKVTIPRTEIDRQFDESLGEMTKEAHVPGFRPGHAPRQLVQKKFRKEVAGQVKSLLLMTALERIEEDHKLHPISQPQFDAEAVELPDAGSMSFELELEVRPDFELPDYTNMTVKRAIRNLTEADVDAQYKNFLERYARLVPKLEGGAEVGDYLVADLTFRDGDTVLNEAKEMQFRLQSELRFQDGKISTIGEVLAGAKPGETRRAHAEIGTSSTDARLRGRKIEVEIKLNDLKTLRMPEVDSNFFEEIGFESEEDLRSALRGVIERRLEFQQREAIRTDIMAQLSAKTPFDLPADLVARQERDVFRRQIYDLRDSGLSDAQIRAREAEIRANAHESTLKTLKEFFILAKIAEKEGLSVSEDDIEAEILSIAQRTDESPRRIRARVQKEKLEDSMATQILERKAIDHILKTVKYEDVVLEEEKPVEVLDRTVSSVPAESAEEAGSESQAESEA